jgi:hypothetical protein
MIPCSVPFARLRHCLFPAALAVALLCGAGCAITPRTAALRQIHQTYQEDFAAFSLPGPGGMPLPPAPTNAPAFARTLQAIHDYRLRYPGDSQEGAHLKVLEGMIYLQSGRVGLARAVAGDVKTAGARLGSATGRTVRDQLLARNFDALVKGWSEIREWGDRNSATVAEWKPLEQAADALRTDLGTLTAGQLADPDADQGALYLANTAAIFYVWAYALRAVEDPAGAEQARTKWFDDARQLLGRFLTDTEKRPEAAQDLAADAPGRLRSVLWYDWLGKEVRGR